MTIRVFEQRHVAACAVHLTNNEVGTDDQEPQQRDNVDQLHRSLQTLCDLRDLLHLRVTRQVQQRLLSVLRQGAALLLPPLMPTPRELHPRLQPQCWKLLLRSCGPKGMAAQDHPINLA